MTAEHPDREEQQVQSLLGIVNQDAASPDADFFAKLRERSTREFLRVGSEEQEQPVHDESADQSSVPP